MDHQTRIAATPDTDTAPTLTGQVQPAVMPPDGIAPALRLLVQAFQAVKAADWSAAKPTARMNALSMAKLITDLLEP